MQTLIWSYAEDIPSNDMNLITDETEIRSIIHHAGLTAEQVEGRCPWSIEDVSLIMVKLTDGEIDELWVYNGCVLLNRSEMYELTRGLEK